MKQESKEVSNVSDGENLRIQAIIWWHDLDFDEREKYYDGYKKWTPAKDHTQLTGREIQNIWAVAMNPPEPKEEPVSLSVEETAKSKYPDRTTPGWNDHWNRSAQKYFIEGADWQKQQSEYLIKELLEVLKSVKSLNLHLYDEGTVGNRVKLSVESAIIKAETYLSK